LYLPRVAFSQNFATKPNWNNYLSDQAHRLKACVRSSDESHEREQTLFFTCSLQAQDEARQSPTHRLESLTERERLIVARWTLKTAAVLRP